MRHMYIPDTKTIDEKKTISDAIDKSKSNKQNNPDGEPVEVHYHSAKDPCEAKYRHRIFVQGHERVAGAAHA